jgi:hypothetical protein
MRKAPSLPYAFRAFKFAGFPLFPVDFFENRGNAGMWMNAARLVRPGLHQQPTSEKLFPDEGLTLFF